MPASRLSFFLQFPFAFSLTLDVQDILSFVLFVSQQSSYASLTPIFLFLADFQYVSSFFNPLL